MAEINNYVQLCVWHGTMLGNNTENDFVNFMKDEFGVRIKFCEEVITNGNIERNEEGGRHDLLFFVHSEDLQSFAMKRLEYGIRWWEDVVKYNDGAYLYSEEILNKYPVTW
jgi:hypothetical protein